MKYRDYLRQRITSLLHISEADIRQDRRLTDLGLESLGAVHLQSDIRRDLGVDIALIEFLGEATIDSVAMTLASHANDQNITRTEAIQAIEIDIDHSDYPFPLTEIQEAYWIGRGQEFVLGNIATHFYEEYEQIGLSVQRLEAAWNKLIAYHDMLRAVIQRDGTQRVLNNTSYYTIHMYDLREATDTDIHSTIEHIRDELSHQMFSTDRWPLFDIRASLLPQGRVRLHLSFDVLILDFTSFLLLMQQWHLLYDDPQTRLPELPFTFRDYVLTQINNVQTETYQKAAQYWKTRVATLPDGPEIALEIAPETVKQPRFVRYSEVIDSETWTRLKAQAAQRGITPSALLLAAFAYVLESWSNRTPFTLNITLFNRPPIHPQINHIVGDFTSTSLLEVSPRSNNGELLPFGVFAQQTNRQLWQDLEHSAFSGIKVQREVAQNRGAAFQPTMPIVFTSGLGAPHYASGEPFPTMWLGEQTYGISQTPQVWLDYQVREDRGMLRYNWDVVAALFPPGYLDGLFVAYTELLTTLATTPTAWEASTLPLLPAAQHALMTHANTTVGPAPTSLLQQPLLAWAAQQPHAPAVVTPTTTTTYHDLVQTALALVATFPPPLTPGTLVGVLLPHSPDHVVATLALLYAGAAYLPLEVTWPPARIAQVLAQAQVTYVLTTPTLCADHPWPPGVTPLPVDLGTLPTGVVPIPPVAVPLDAVAYVIFTSGSTGTPKGVTLSHGAAHNTLADITRRFGVTAQDRVLGLSALSFDLSVYDIFGLLGVGGTVVLPDPAHQRDPAHWLRCLGEQQVTIWNSAPALLEMLLTYAEAVPAQARSALASLRLVLLSGDWIPVTVPERLWRLAPQAVVHSLGGATEGAIWSIGYPVTKVEPSWRSIPYGQALTNQTMWVLDAALGHCPVGVPGQLHIGGQGLAQGYWRDPVRTAERFVPEPWGVGTRLYQTGDQGCWRPEGTITFLGRLDQQVKLRGHRVELGEVAVRLAEVAELPQAEAQVVMAGGQARLVGYVVGRAGAQAVAAWQEALREVVPGYMVPSQVVVLSHWPVTPNGKLDRKALPNPFETNTPTPIETQQTSVQSDTRVAHILTLIEKTLNQTAFDPSRNLLTIGATSLEVVRLTNALEEQLGIRPTFMELVEFSSIQVMAETYANQLQPQPELSPYLVSETNHLIWSDSLEHYRVHNVAQRHMALHNKMSCFGPPAFETSIPLKWSKSDFPGSVVTNQEMIPFNALCRWWEAIYTRKAPSDTSSTLLRLYLYHPADRVTELDGGWYLCDFIEKRLCQLEDYTSQEDFPIHNMDWEALEQCSFALYFVATPTVAAITHGGLALAQCLIDVGRWYEHIESATQMMQWDLHHIRQPNINTVRHYCHLLDEEQIIHALCIKNQAFTQSYPATDSKSYPLSESDITWEEGVI